MQHALSTRLRYVFVEVDRALEKHVLRIEKTNRKIQEILHIARTTENFCMLSWRSVSTKHRTISRDSFQIMR